MRFMSARSNFPAGNEHRVINFSQERGLPRASDRLQLSGSQRHLLLAGNPFRDAAGLLKRLNASAKQPIEVCQLLVKECARERRIILVADIPTPNLGDIFRLQYCELANSIPKNVVRYLKEKIVRIAPLASTARTPLAHQPQKKNHRGRGEPEARPVEGGV